MGLILLVTLSEYQHRGTVLRAGPASQREALGLPGVQKSPRPVEGFPFPFGGPGSGRARALDAPGPAEASSRGDAVNKGAASKLLPPPPSVFLAWFLVRAGRGGHGGWPAHSGGSGRW